MAAEEPPYGTQGFLLQRTAAPRFATAVQNIEHLLGFRAYVSAHFSVKNKMDRRAI
jgi:hypothetical protein